VSWLRRRDARPATAEFEETTTPESQDGIKGETGLAPEDSYAAKQALSRLPEDWQVLLVARYVDGRTIDTLVSASGRSRASVNRDLKRARAAFRGELFAGTDGDDDGIESKGEEDLR
jgi:DNA-directed RNA polymerase specialized sigma24 family protein